MTRRLGVWALAGIVVACCWVIAGILAGPEYNLGFSIDAGDPVGWLARITAPASLVGLKIPVAFYWFILLNSVAYALIGLVAEGFSRVLIAAR